MVKTDLIRTREAVGEREASVDGSRRQLVANIIIVIRILEVREQKVRPGCGSVEEKSTDILLKECEMCDYQKGSAKAESRKVKKKTEQISSSRRGERGVKRKVVKQAGQLKEEDNVRTWEG